MARTVKEILEQHLEWWQGNGGVQLCWLGLLDEEKANLRSADLRSADLSYADLRYANLRYANLSSADLSSADLRYANLSYADLRYANLRYANLSYANLSSADLSSADLRSTQIDPTNAPNQQSDSFKEDAGEGWVYGYRTRETSAAGRELVDDRIYGCEVFSTCDTECHPGWYLWPTYESAKQWSRAETVRVKTRRITTHPPTQAADVTFVMLRLLKNTPDLAGGEKGGINESRSTDTGKPGSHNTGNTGGD